MRRAIAALCLLAACSAPAAATDGVWSTEFWELRKCNMSGKLRYDGFYYAMGFSWTDAKQSVEFFVTEMSGTAGGKEQLSIESPSLDKPWFPIVGLVDYQSGPQVEALRRDIARGSPWRLSVKPKRRKPLILDAPPSNGRTQMAMFDACVATTARFPGISNEPTAPPLHWSINGEASSCQARTRFRVGTATLELLMEARREEFDVLAWISDAQAARTMSIDLAAIGGPRTEAGQQVRFTLGKPERAALLDELGNAVTVAVSDTSGGSWLVPLVPPQDVVDVAMFRACVAALEPPSDP
jgi:hypothetical protein